LTNKFKPDPVLNENINTEFVKDEFKDQYVPLPQKVYVKAGEMMSDKGYEEAYLGDHLRFKMKREGKRFWAGDNISDFLHEGDKEKLIDEAAEAFETVLDRLLIDRETDPNSKGKTLQRFQMIQRTVTKVCWLSVASYAVCVVIITSPLVAWHISASLPQKNSSAFLNTLVSHSGVPGAARFKKSWRTTLPEKSCELQVPRM